MALPAHIRPDRSRELPGINNRVIGHGTDMIAANLHVLFRRSMTRFTGDAELRDMRIPDVRFPMKSLPGIR